jgi:hypothetical protein
MDSVTRRLDSVPKVAKGVQQALGRAVDLSRSLRIPGIYLAVFAAGVNQAIDDFFSAGEGFAQSGIHVKVSCFEKRD